MTILCKNCGHGISEKVLEDDGYILRGWLHNAEYRPRLSNPFKPIPISVCMVRIEEKDAPLIPYEMRKECGCKKPEPAEVK